MMDLADLIVRDVAELPDRTSPDDQPDMLLVTADELRGIIRERQWAHSGSSATPSRLADKLMEFARVDEVRSIRGLQAALIDAAIALDDHATLTRSAIAPTSEEFTVKCPDCGTEFEWTPAEAVRPELLGVLDAIEDYLEGHEDIRDGGDGTPLPNDAMHLLFQLREARRFTVSATLSTSAQEVFDNWSAYLRPVDREDFRKQLAALYVDAPIYEAWVHAYTSLGCDRDNAERMVQNEINAYKPAAADSYISKEK